MAFFQSKTFAALSILVVAGGIGTYIYANELASWEESIKHPAKVGTGGFSEGDFAKEHGLFLVSTDRSQANFWNNKFSTSQDKSTKTLLTRNGQAPWDAFKLVDKAFSDDTKDITALNRMCEAAYSATPFDPSTVPSEESEDSPEELMALAENIWYFCAPKTVTLTEASTSEPQSSSTKIKDSPNRKSLVDTSNSDNDWFWRLRDSEFWNKQEGSSRSGSHAQNNSLFHKLYTEHKEKPEKPNIKNTCHQAYEKGSPSEQDKEDTFLFCSLYKAVAEEQDGE